MSLPRSAEVNYYIDTLKFAKETISHSNKLRCGVCGRRIPKGNRYWFWPDPYKHDDSERANWGRIFRAHLECLE